MKKQLHPAMWFAAFFNFYSFQYFIPFKIIWDEDISNFKIRNGTSFHKSLCALQHTALVWYTFHVMWNVCTNFAENPWEINNLFQTASTMIYAYVGLLIAFGMWTCQSKFSELFSSLKFDVLRTDETSNIKTPKVWYTNQQHVIAYLTCLLHYLFGISYLIPVSTLNGNVNRFTSSVTNFFSSTIGNLIDLHSFKDSFIAAGLKTFFNYIVIFEGIQCAVFETSMEYLLFCVAFAVNQIETNLKFEMNKMTVTPSQMLSVYQNVKRRIIILNNHTGLLVLVNYVSFVTYYAILPAVFKSEVLDFKQKAGVTVYMVVTILAWIVTASFHHSTRSFMINQVRELQLQDVTIKDRFRLMSLLNELDTFPLAVSCRFFNVTNEFISSMTGLLITYAIIILQIGSPAVL